MNCAAWVGLSVTALIPLMSAVAAITSANCRYIWPVIPAINDAGKNTAINTNVIPIIGPSSSFIALIAACRGVSPCSTFLATPSTTTIASSTTIPIQRTIAKSVNKLIEKPIPAMHANAPIIVTGTVVAGTSVARQSCKNSMITSRTRMPASKSV